MLVSLQHSFISTKFFYFRGITPDEVIKMKELATPEDDKRLEEKILQLNKKDLLVNELIKKVVNSKRKIDPINIINYREIMENNGHSLTKEEIQTSMYKLYRNGKLQQKRYHNSWRYFIQK